MQGETKCICGRRLPRLKVNDIAILTMRVKCTRHAGWITEYCIKVRITSADEAGRFTYQPTGISKGYCGFGSAMLPIYRQLPCGQFGLMRIDVIGNEKPRYIGRGWQPKPGDRGYDLMC